MKIAALILSVVVAFSAASQELKAGEQTVELGGMKLWYKVAGAGPVCVMPSPGWGPASDFYFRTLRPLEKHFTVVYLDTRGTGRSGRAAEATEYTWGHQVADLENLRQHLKLEKWWLMGHSEGGAQALHYAAKHPERVAGLVIVDVLAVSDDEHREDVSDRAMLRMNKPWFDKAMAAMRAKAETDEQLQARIRDMLPLYFSDPAKIEKFAKEFAEEPMSAAASAGQKASKRYPFDVREGLKKVDAPTLILVGDDDYICSPVAAKRIQGAIKNSKLVEIAKAGHFPWCEQPEAFYAAVAEFMKAK